MADNLGITKPTVSGDNNQWGTKLNTLIDQINARFGDVTTVATTGGTTNLTQSQQNAKVIKITGTLTSNAIIQFLAAKGGSWVIINETDGDYTVTVRIASQTGFEVNQGESAVAAYNGTDLFQPGVSARFVGEVVDYAGLTAPDKWLFAYGQAISRTTYAALFGAITINQSGTTTSGSKVVTGLSDTSNMRAGMAVSGTGIATGSSIVSVDSSSQITLSANATGSATVTITVAPYGIGDGSTTFNLPDLRGRVTAGKDDMGGSAAGRLSQSYFGVVQSGTTTSGSKVITGLSDTSVMRAGMTVKGTGIASNSIIATVDSSSQITLNNNCTASGTVPLTIGEAATALGASGGEDGHTLTIAEMPAHTHDENSSVASGTLASGNVPVYRNQYDSLVNVPTASAGGGAAHNNIQPTIVVNKIIYAGV